MTRSPHRPPTAPRSSATPSAPEPVEPQSSAGAEAPDKVTVDEEISARAAAEKALVAEQSRLRSILDAIPDLVWMKDVDGAFVACNQAFERLMGAPEPELVGRTDYDFVEREHADLFRFHDRKAMSQDAPVVNEEWVTFASDGTRVLIETKKTAIRDPAGRPLGTVGVARDVTAARAAAAALHRSEERLRLFVEHAPVAIAMFDLELRYLSTSRRWVTENELGSTSLGGRLHYEVHPGLPEHWKEAHRRALAGEVVRADEDRIVQADGTTRWVRWEVHPWRDAQDEIAGIVIFSEDITERRQAQAAVDRYFEGSPAVIYALRVDPDDLRAVWLGGSIERLTGWGQEHAFHPTWWIDNLHPEDRERVTAIATVPYEIDHQTIEFRFRRRDGTYFWIRDEKRLLRDAEGRPAEVVGSWTDVTERVELEEQLRVSQKLEAIGRLAGGVAHDFNNLLTVITGNGELLSQGLAHDEMWSTLVGEIQDAAARASALTRQLLAFGRSQILSPKVVRLDALVKRFEPMLRPLIGEDVQLVCELSPDTGHVRVDPGQIEQILLNLAANARDAMPQGGRLLLRTEPVTRPGAADQARLTFADTGCGMSESVKARIFEPFFSTKPQGAGSGLGLATVFGIVKQSGGQIEVESKEGAGATFVIELPRVEAASSPVAESAPTFRHEAGGETVLLAEDEPGVRRLARITLEKHGYKVLAAASGEEALELAARNGETIDLLVSDLVMPGISGRELADELRSRRPGLPVLLMSGYPQDTLDRHGVDDAAMEFLHKPFTLATFAERVRAVLDAARADDSRSGTKPNPPSSS